MFAINESQMCRLQDVAWLRFVDEMVAHGKVFAPRLSEVLGDERLRVAVLRAIDKAQRHGFTLRGPIRLCIELMFLCGSAFDTDPQYPAIGATLRSAGEQMRRAQAIRAGVVDYVDRVCGPQGANVRAALESLANFAQAPMRPSSDDFVTAMQWELLFIFPKKAAWVGPDGLVQLIENARAIAQRHRLAGVRAEAMIVALNFAFGHGCTDDPLYPWISATLTDERIVDPAARAARLEKKAMTWLHHVLARPQLPALAQAA